MSKISPPPSQTNSVFEDLMRTDLAQWKSVVSRVQDPVTARLVVQFLDAHPQLKEKRAGVYLAAAETVQRDRIRFAKGYRTGRTVASVVTTCLRLSKALIGHVRSSTREQPVKASPVPLQPAAPQVASRPPAATRADDSLVFPVIVDPFAGRASTVH